jgi:hypothetical protein
MSEIQSKENNKAYICKLTDKEDSNRIGELTNIPQYMCFKCGRAANEKENLCNPKAFYELEVFPVPLE